MTVVRRRALRVLRIAAAIAGTGVLVGCLILLRDPRPRIERRRSHLVSATVDALASDQVHRVQLVHLRAASGLKVELAVKRPLASDAACADSATRPIVVLLGGHRTGREAVNLIDDTRGTVVAALSYPFAGNPRVKGVAIVREVPAIRAAVLDTPAAVMLAIDYLVTLPCVNPAMLEAVGVSLGAPFAVIAGAMDERIRRVWSIHGAGGVYTPLEFNLRRQLGSRAGSVPVAAVATVLLAGERLAPERWVDEIAPRSLVMINARDDDRLPRHAVDRLYRSAGNPKEMIWMPGSHVRSEADVVRPLIDLVLTRIVGDPRTSAAAPARRSP